MRMLNRPEPRSTVSFALSVGVHVLMIAVLFFAISWKTRPPAPVVAELWTPAEVAPPRPAPRPEPAPAPKPEPKIEPKAPEKPDIALEREVKRLEELERKRREDERKRQELEKKRHAEALRRQEAEKKRKEEEARATAERELKEREAEERLLKQDLEDLREQRLQEQLSRELAKAPATARSAVPVPGDPGAADAYRAKIIAKIRGNIVLPPDIVGNPEAEFLVQQLPSGDIVSVKLARSSGSPALDDAWERAIRKSSPLPLPENRGVFQATLRLRFRPTEER